MNAEIKAQWVAALRSGEYRQGRSQLRTETPDGHRYCCLGVLCDLAAKAGIGHWFDNVFYKTDVDTHYSEDYSATIPPEFVWKWAGYTATDSAGFLIKDPIVAAQVDSKTSESLVGLNDNWNWSFEEIANAVEAEATL